MDKKALPAHATAGFSRAEWHDKAWELYHGKTFNDTQLATVNMHTIRAVFDATFDALSNAPTPSEDARDAARYRALRDRRYMELPRVSDPHRDDITYTSEGLDKAIDAVIAMSN